MARKNRRLKIEETYDWWRMAQLRKARRRRKLRAKGVAA